jgi:hypothetical protein
MSKVQHINKINLLIAALSMVALVHVPSASHANVDLEVENEATFADSEGALAEAEDARRRADDEKQRARSEAVLAKKETIRAKQVEASSKKKMSKFLDEEKKNRQEREIAEKKTKAAREEIRKHQAEVAAKEMELNALKEITDKSVAERDEAELQLIKLKDQLNKTQIRIGQEKKRNKEMTAAAARSKAKVQAAEQKLSNLQNGREPSSGAGATAAPVPAAASSGGARSEGWVTVRRDCAKGLRAQADDAAPEAGVVKMGDKFYGKKISDQWIEVRSGDRAPTYLPMGCVR